MNQTLNKNLDLMLKEICAENISVFCGAGISINSGLPSAPSIVEKIMVTLGAEASHISTLMDSDLPFEAFMQIISEVGGQSILFKMFSLGEPNRTHKLLARLANKKQIRLICTTNFDSLIEQACDMEGMTAGVDYKVYSSENQFHSIEWNDNSHLKIIKIHGTIDNLEAISITLKQVSRHFHSECRVNTLNHIFSGGDDSKVLVLGYSCSDVFDISPSLQRIEQQHSHVVFIDHINTKKASYEDISLKQEKNPFIGFPDSVRIYYDTDSLVDIWFGDGPLKKGGITKKLMWEESVSEWHQNLKESMPYSTDNSILAKVFQTISEFDIAIEYWSKELSREAPIALKSKTYFGLGQSLLDIGQYDKSKTYLFKALAMAVSNNDISLQVLCHNVIARLEMALGNYIKSKQSSQQALWLANTQEDEEMKAASLSGLGVALYSLGEYPPAIVALESALSESRKMGDKENEQIVLGNLGNIYLRIGEIEKSKYYYMDALEIAKLLGDLEREASWLGNLGVVSRTLKEFDIALEFHQEEMRLSKKVGDKESEGISLGNIGDVHFDLNNYILAEEYYKKALDIAISIGDKEGHSLMLGSIADIQLKRGQAEEAILTIRESISIATEMEDHENHGYQKAKLADAYSMLDNSILAQQYFKEAYLILQPILGKENEFVYQIRCKWPL